MRITVGARARVRARVRVRVTSSRSRESTRSGMRCAVFGPAQCLRILTLPPFPAKPPASGKGAVASGRNGGAATTVVDWVDWLSVGSALKLV